METAADNPERVSKPRPPFRVGKSPGSLAALAMYLCASDRLNWSQPHMQYRVRLHAAPLPEGLTGVERLNAIMGRRTSFGDLLQSKTKGKRFHGYLEGDYKLVTSGFYTNNLDGLRRLFQKYPDLFESVQTQDQFRAARELSSLLSTPIDSE